MNRTTVGRTLALLGAVGPAFYIFLTLVLGLLWESYTPIQDTQSELGAVDSPYRTVMNVAGFMVLGLCILAFAGAYALLLQGGWAKRIAVGFLVVAGMAMVVVGFFPCDAECVDVTRTGRFHGFLSAPGAVGLPVAAMLSARVFREDGRLSLAPQMASFWVGLVSLVSGPVVAVEWIETGLGLLQRAGMWPTLLWMMVVSAWLFRRGDISSPPSPAHATPP